MSSVRQQFGEGADTPRVSAAEQLNDDVLRAAGMRPLVVRCGAFGETVLITALLAQLHARFDTQVDVVSSGPWSRPLLETHRAVNKIFVIRSRNTPYWLESSQQRLVRWLSERGAGPTWFCDASPVVRRLLARAGVPDDYICDVRTLPALAGEHFVERWTRFGQLTPTAFRGLLPQAGGSVASSASLHLSAASVSELDRWLDDRGLSGTRFIAVQAGNKRSMRGLPRSRATNTKYWPETNWARVIRALRELHPDHAILLLGVPRESKLNSDIARLAAVPRVYDVADDLPIRILLPLLARATGMIAVDTGPAHAAAALGCATVALFGAADPRLYRPGGVTTPAIVLTAERNGKPCMRAIAPEEVIAAWKRLHCTSACDRGGS
jgi:heptosyltransferase-2/heptosyltransferase-3